MSFICVLAARRHRGTRRRPTSSGRNERVAHVRQSRVNGMHRHCSSGGSAHQVGVSGRLAVLGGNDDGGGGEQVQGLELVDDAADGIVDVHERGLQPFTRSELQMHPEDTLTLTGMRWPPTGLAGCGALRSPGERQALPFTGVSTQLNASQEHAHLWDASLRCVCRSVPGARCLSRYAITSWGCPCMHRGCVGRKKRHKWPFSQDLGGSGMRRTIFSGMHRSISVQIRAWSVAVGVSVTPSAPRV